MDAIITRLTLRPPVEWNVLATAFSAFEASLTPYRPAFHGASLVRTGESEAVILVIFADRATLDAVSRDIAAPWFAEHVRPLLAAPAERLVGPILAGSLGV